MTGTTAPRRRADAELNRRRIIQATREVLSQDPSASIEEIARAAGVGRMTLYGHFRTRADLLTAALADAVDFGGAALTEVDLDGPPREAMRRLLRSSWSLVEQSAALLVAADGIVPAEEIKRMHGIPARRVEGLIRRGQREGDFRSDLSATWLVSAVHYVLHGAAAEVRAGRLPAKRAAESVTRTIEGMLAPPTGPGAHV
jgi:AcrR family transcriptional regulator